METNFVDQYLNKDFLNDTFSRYFNKSCNLKSIKTSEGNFGDGMLSVLKRIRLDWPEDGIPPPGDSLEKYTSSVEHYPTSIVAKIRCNENLTTSDVMTNEHVDSENSESLKFVHPNECAFYTLIAPRIKPRGIIPIPTCYAAMVDSPDRGDGVILMEDLSAPSCHTVDVIRGLDKEHLMQIAFHLAKFHAWCLTTDYEWRRNFRRINEFPNFIDFVTVLVENVFKNLRENYGRYFEKIEPNLWRRIFRTKFSEWSMWQNRFEILGHGDLWIRNILWKSDGKRVAAFIDWQFANIGGLADDLARVMTYSVRTETRRSEERNVLSHYYQTLKRDLDESESEYAYSKEKKIPLPEFEDLFTQYQRCFAFETFFYLGGFGLLLEGVSRIEASNSNEKLAQTPAVVEMLERASASLEDAQNLFYKFQSV